MVRKIFGLSLLALFMVSITACGGGNGGSSADRGEGIEEEGITTCGNATSDLPDNCLSALANITLKLVENGTFAMGSDSNNSTTYANIKFTNPKHNVTISKPFYLGIYEVTQEQWKNVSGSNPSVNGNWKSEEIANGTTDILKHPVENVSRQEALDFIQALNDAEPNIMINGEQYVYDLPSEAEWEYAARGGTTTERYSCEDNVSQDDCKQITKNHEWFGVSRHREVGTKLPNPWGFYDMYGNAIEWVLDRGAYAPDCKYLQEDIIDPLCYNDGSSNFIVRGQAYGDPLIGIYSAARNSTPVSRTQYIGFRVALVAKSVRDNMTKFANGVIIE